MRSSIVTSSRLAIRRTDTCPPSRARAITSMKGLENRGGGRFRGTTRPLLRSAASETDCAAARDNAPSTTSRHFRAEAVTCNSSATRFSRRISFDRPGSIRPAAEAFRAHAEHLRQVVAAGGEIVGQLLHPIPSACRGSSSKCSGCIASVTNRMWNSSWARSKWRRPGTRVPPPETRTTACSGMRSGPNDEHRQAVVLDRRTARIGKLPFQRQRLKAAGPGCRSARRAYSSERRPLAQVCSGVLESGPSRCCPSVGWQSSGSAAGRTAGARVR